MTDQGRITFVTWRAVDWARLPAADAVLACALAAEITFTNPNGGFRVRMLAVERSAAW